MCIVELKELISTQLEMNGLLIDNAETGSKIKSLCNAKGITCAELAEVLGLTGPQAVYNWIEGKSKPTLDNIIKIAYLLRVDVKDIVQICE
jgi:transcriptional regulator with XRE-family HTH domain